LPIEEVQFNGVWDYKVWLHDPQHILAEGAAALESGRTMTLLNDAAHIYQAVPSLSVSIEGKVMACRVLPVDGFDAAKFADCVGPFRYADFSRYLDADTCKLVQHLVGLYRTRQRGPD
jgi:hypothetical protein